MAFSLYSHPKKGILITYDELYLLQSAILIKFLIPHSLAVGFPLLGERVRVRGTKIISNVCGLKTK